MWYTRNKSYSETAEENLQEAKIACEEESPWTYNIEINSQKLLLYISAVTVEQTYMTVQNKHDSIKQT